MKSVARRVSDKQILHLIKMWLLAPVEEIDDRGRTHRTTVNKDRGRGCPQGAPISPLLANLYMRRFVLGWKVLGHERRLGAKVVSYADDVVICCRGTGEVALATLQSMMRQLRLTVNEAKTRLVFVPDDSVDFLGYTIGRCYSPKTGRAYIGTQPSRKSVQRVCRQVSELTGHRWLLLDAENRVSRINRLLRGWSSYFRLGPVSKAYRGVDLHTSHRLRQWLRAKHKVPGSGISRFPDETLYQELNLVRLQERTRNFPWANA
jgi:RNA-directed DNA polymerase